MEDSHLLHEGLCSKHPDLTIRLDRDGQLQELKGIFEENAFIFRLGHGFASLELHKEGNELKIVCGRSIKQGVHWHLPTSVTLNGCYFSAIELYLSIDAMFGEDTHDSSPFDEAAQQQQARVAFKHGARILERFDRFLQQRFSEIYELCNKQRRINDQSFAVFEPPLARTIRGLQRRLQEQVEAEDYEAAQSTLKLLRRYDMKRNMTVTMGEARHQRISGTFIEFTG